MVEFLVALSQIIFCDSSKLFEQLLQKLQLCNLFTCGYQSAISSNHGHTQRQKKDTSYKRIVESKVTTVWFSNRYRNANFFKNFDFIKLKSYTRSFCLRQNFFCSNLSYNLKRQQMVAMYFIIFISLINYFV
jgi:hypothetical protein